MASFTHIEGWPDPEVGPVRIELYLQVIGGRIECVGLLIGVLDGHPSVEDEFFYTPIPSRPLALKAGVLRKLHLPDLIERAIAVNEETFKQMAMLDPSESWLRGFEHVVEEAAELLPAIEQRSKRTGRKGHPPERWEKVAAVYRDAHAQRRHPTLAVAEEFNVSKSTAAKYVAKARRLELLPPTTRGKPSI